MGCALAIRAFHFEAKPVVQVIEPKTKILVATRTIPSGVDITADFVAFQEVPLSEVPRGAFSSFAQVYLRRPAYPIPADCPICEDLLRPQSNSATQGGFIPTGNQLVNLDVVHVRHGDKVFSPKESLSTMLDADRRIDVRVIPRNDVQGKLAEKKNAVLRNYVSQDVRESGELLLENVPIHQILRRPVTDHAGVPKDSLVLMLEKEEAAKLTAAAKKGQIRIFVRQNESIAPLPVEIEHIAAENGTAENAVTENVVTENAVEIATFETIDPAPSPEISFAVPPDFPVVDFPVVNFPAVVEQSLSIPAEPTPAIPMEQVQRHAPLPSAFDAMLLLNEPNPDPIPDMVPSAVVRTPQSLDRLDWQSDAPLVSSLSNPNISDEIKVPIRNENPSVTFGVMSPRIVPSERFTEQNPTLPEALPAVESGQETLTHPYSEAVLGHSRVTQTIKFLAPGSAVPVRESLPTMARRAEPVPQKVLPVVPTTPVSPVEPLVVPTPTVSPECPDEGPGYSPWDRRPYLVLPNEELGSNGELAAPPKLLRSSDVGASTK